MTASPRKGPRQGLSREPRRNTDFPSRNGTEKSLTSGRAQRYEELRKSMANSKKEEEPTPPGRAEEIKRPESGSRIQSLKKERPAAAAPLGKPAAAGAVAAKLEISAAAALLENKSPAEP
ncbi:hypothetical protein V500_05835 [Pseudogymnoascus sp. VKM F-4518 (FW-2643)]|nr:hypothetical protein V500_05835 [Pseudogymnoascus sp. VKM F-4518 (FW-2643)]